MQQLNKIINDNKKANKKKKASKGNKLHVTHGETLITPFVKKRLIIY